MTTDRENNAPEVQLPWTRQKQWGFEGFTHHTSAEIHGDAWTFTVDQPSKGRWAVRGWKNGDFALHREDRTVKGAKEQVQAHVDGLAAQPCDTCGPGVARGKCPGPAGLVRSECPQCGDTGACNGGPCPLRSAAGPEAIDEDRVFDAVSVFLKATSASAPDLVRQLRSAAASFRSLADAFRRPVPCGCPTPTHRMSCGRDSQPKVVTS